MEKEDTPTSRRKNNSLFSGDWRYQCHWSHLMKIPTPNLKVQPNSMNECTTKGYKNKSLENEQQQLTWSSCKQREDI